jgi:hypothetical protein
LNIDKAFVVYVRGQSEEAGFQTVSPAGFEYVTKYIEFWLHFIGVHSITAMTVEHTWDGRALDMIDEAKKQAAGLAKQFWNSCWNSISAGARHGRNINTPCRTPSVPAGAVGWAPFNVYNDGNGHLFVSYAAQNAAKHDDVAGSGNGFVDEFDTNGTFIKRVATGGVLDSPW